ncbi:MULTISPECIES: caspase family protein [unclassified Calothrix]|uniref:caspase family protein n=1 Tax=unclassified Calothrix TaxID=2619626 RepID=UPI0018F038E8|nr:MULTISPECIES: caspase family protein [unclassified Calothrix]
MKRRHFLQFSTSTLATLGLSQFDIWQKGNRYGQVLAQDTGRKLALLVGVNDYPKLQGSNLRGCITDVDLQQELLIHRFGFKSEDIVRLTSDPKDEPPTRKNILEKFEKHLIKQAKPGDVVVFHFSGHGSRLAEFDGNKVNNDAYNSTLVTADIGNEPLARDITGRTLFLLISALNTENVTVVLDSCYSGGGTRGNLVIRSTLNNDRKVSEEEIAYQKDLMQRLNINAEELARRRRDNQRKGIVLASAQGYQVAADASFGDFHAGAFTYLLTQYLWQQTGNVGSAIAQVTPVLNSVYRQTPRVDGQANQPVYFINNRIPPTDAVIIEGNGDKATLWLGGVDKESLDAFREKATFAIVNQQGEVSGEVELVSPRRGLKAQAKLIKKDNVTALKSGMLLQELTRIVPKNLKLNIGLDLSLGKDINKAKQAIESINRIQAILPQKQNPPYPNGVQYIFSRITPAYRQKLQQQSLGKLPDVNSLCLFTEGGELVLESFDNPGETVEDAVKRLNPKLKSMLAASIIKKTLNSNSSALDVEAGIYLLDEPGKMVARTATKRHLNNRGNAEEIYSRKVIVKKQFQFRVTNNESTPVYFAVLLFDSTGDLLVVFPYEWAIAEESMVLPANKTVDIGNPIQAIEKGTGEALIIISKKPLKNAVKTLSALAREQKRDRGTLILRGETRGADEIMGDLLSDLTDVRGGIVVQQATPISNSDTATLSISFDVG